jgi:hypothetical protein
MKVDGTQNMFQEYANTTVFPLFKPHRSNSNFLNTTHDLNTRQKKKTSESCAISLVQQQGRATRREQKTAADVMASSSTTSALRCPTSRSARCSSCSRSFSPRHAAHPLAPPVGYLPMPPLPVMAATREP